MINNLNAVLNLINGMTHDELAAYLRMDEVEEVKDLKPFISVKRDYNQESLKAEYDAQIKLESMMGDI